MATTVIAARAPYQVGPLIKHTATVIFLHGISDSTGGAWFRVAKMTKYQLPHVKWLLPNAPSRSLTVSPDLATPSWFDAHLCDMDGNEDDRAGILDSARTIDKLIEDEINAGIPSERIVVGGYDEGGALALLVGLTTREPGGHGGWKLGGVVVLSGWMPLRDEFPKMVSPHLANTPVLMCHCDGDYIVSYTRAEEASEMLTNNLGLPDLGEDNDNLGAVGLSFRTYDFGVSHEGCQHGDEMFLEELDDLTQFLKRVLPRDY